MAAAAARPPSRPSPARPAADPAPAQAVHRSSARELSRCLVAASSCSDRRPRSPASATGGINNVVKCHPWHMEADEIEQAGGHPSYTTVDDCQVSSGDPKIGIQNTGAAGNSSYSQLMYSSRLGTHIETVCLAHRLRRDSHHRAEILAFPGFQLLAAGGDEPGGWVNECFDVNHSQIIIRLSATRPAAARRVPTHTPTSATSSWASPTTSTR